MPHLHDSEAAASEQKLAAQELDQTGHEPLEEKKFSFRVRTLVVMFLFIASLATGSVTMVANFRDRVTALEQNQMFLDTRGSAALQKYSEKLDANLSGLRTDVASVKTEMAVLKEDVRHIRELLEVFEARARKENATRVQGRVPTKLDGSNVHPVSPYWASPLVVNRSEGANLQ